MSLITSLVPFRYELTLSSFKKENKKHFSYLDLVTRIINAKEHSSQYCLPWILNYVLSLPKARSHHLENKAFHIKANSAFFLFLKHTSFSLAHTATHFVITIKTCLNVNVQHSSTHLLNQSGKH